MQLVPILKMSGALPQLPPFLFTARFLLEHKDNFKFFCTFTKINPSLTLSKSMCACVNACARAHALVERKLNIFCCLKSLEYIWMSSLCADSVSAHRAVLAGRKWWVQKYLQGAMLEVQISCN
jgi:hypothetical protein